MAAFATAVANLYRKLVEDTHPGAKWWPILSGHNWRSGTYKNAGIVHLQHSGMVAQFTGNIGELTFAQVGVDEINEHNRNSVIARLEVVLSIQPQDILIVAEKAIQSDGTWKAPTALIMQQLQDALRRHEAIQGLLPMKIFLSHKGADKPKVREYKKVLELLGFDPWLDEDAMAAGVALERGILEGFKDSCAAVFFVTPKFVDENFLASEVNYAIAEKRKKGDRFQIITLVFQHDGKKGAVPELLQTYVWKEPENDIDGLREVLKALPLAVGPVRWRR